MVWAVRGRRLPRQGSGSLKRLSQTRWPRTAAPSPHPSGSSPDRFLNSFDPGAHNASFSTSPLSAKLRTQARKSSRPTYLRPSLHSTLRVS